MTAALALLHGRRVVTVCCAKHMGGGLGWCCQIDTCIPCCPECPTCPDYMSLESAHPGWRRRAAADQRRWRNEWMRERVAMWEIGRTLWWFDRGDWSRTVILPQVPEFVRTSRVVERTTWDLEVW